MKLDDLNATKASSAPFEFEYIDHKGNPTGIFFIVLGGESEEVKAETCRLQNERRQRAAARAVSQRVGVITRKAEFDRYEDDVEYGRRIAASRLIGWRGIDDEFSKENALKLCQNNDHIAATITAQSEAMENFIKV